MSISLTVSAQEQSKPPQTPPQEESKPPDASVEPERWNLFYQATSIGDEHGTFHCAYTEVRSAWRIIPSTMSRSQALLFFSVRLEQNTVFVFNPEIAGGKGFSGVDGIANPPNGEIPRVASATPKPYHRAVVHPA